MSLVYAFIANSAGLHFVRFICIAIRLFHPMAFYLQLGILRKPLLPMQLATGVYVSGILCSQVSLQLFSKYPLRVWSAMYIFGLCL